MVTALAPEPPDVVAKDAAALVEDRLTVVAPAALAALPNPSCSCTVMGPIVAVDDATPDAAPVVKASFAAGPGLMVACCAADPRPLAVPVIVGEPALESP